MTSPSAFPIGHVSPEETEALIALWQACELTRPWNDPHADITLAKRGPHSTILVARDGATLAGSVMVGHDGHRGWMYYLAVSPAHQRKGLGRILVAAAEDWLRARGVPKVMLLVRPDNEKVRGFYDALGYQDEPRTVFSRRLDGAD
ncbi:GNAT family acetyltransferase [Azorhizobium oxalatiphilum]|uniref:GNAT family acetyltransferase n=1 Tax=Azorhizobium oxalatiphilum TaxID=980631 RepID=A0A917CGE2_9HYPH|nr:GNAT family acetyltransferase [Azorhizobium oxalatiphilum]GGF87709.1 GNAT family acetyltransferase [Azorhizobium oxalatiphilum]